jgi:serine/threonine-protein kinase
VVHRDLRPQNVLLEKRANNPEFVKVLDFGLAKLLPAKLDISPVGQTVGVVEYNSPEQLRGLPIDARSDLYALGVLGFRLVTGRHPFEHDRTYGQLIDAHINKPPPLASLLRPGLPADVDAILARLLAKDPEHRFPDAPSLAALIGVLLDAQPADAGDTIRTDVGEEDTVLAPIDEPKR